MADLGDLSTDPDFGNLSPDAKRIVLDQVGGQDKDFQALSPDAQNLVKLRLMAPASSMVPQQPSLAEQAATFGRRHILPAILPTAGALLGSAGGAALGSPTIAGIPAGILAGEAAGSLAGEKLNQLFGITDPSTLQLILAGAAPGIGRAIGYGARGGLSLGARFLPGAPGALQETGINIARGLPSLVRPLENIDALYSQAAQVGGSTAIRTPMLNRVVEDLLAHEAKIQPGLRNSRLETMLMGFRDALAGGAPPGLAAPSGVQAGTIPFDVLHANLKRVGDRLASAEGEELGALKSIYRAALTDLEATPEGLGLRQATHAAKLEFATNDLANIIEKNISTAGEQGQAQRFAPNKVLDWIRKTDDGQKFAKTVGADTLNKITETLTDLNKIPRLPPPSSANVGSLKGLARVTGLGGFGYFLGGPETAAGGAALGGIMNFLSPLVARALMTDGGRTLLKRAVLDGGGTLDHRALATIAAGLRAASGPSMPETP